METPKTGIRFNLMTFPSNDIAKPLIYAILRN